MKPSIYNHFVPISGDKVICYNAFADSYLVTKQNNIGKISPDTPLYQQFVDNGFFVDDDFDEKTTFLDERQKSIHSSDSYDLIVNPTIDCNLKCWYCYEKHIESGLSGELIVAIVKHIELKFNEIKFKELTLSFFGGEPLLQIETVKRLITNAKLLSEKFGFNLSIAFTTNGTIITNEFLSKLQTLNTSFQITLDGNEECHNRIRKLKRTGEGTYTTILCTIEKILSALQNKTDVVLRVNISAATVSNIDSILKDIGKFSVYRNFSVSLHKVWQVSADKIDEDKILSFVSKCQSLGIKCNYLNLQKCYCSCYADYENEVIVNYDGLVYKCTARDFTKANSYGHLDLNGEIIWDKALLSKRMSIPLPQKCDDCGLLPSCPKVCSQKLLENATHICPFEGNYSVSDYIIHNFNNYLIDYKHTIKI